MKTTVYFLMICASLFIMGCSKDDPVTPDPPPPQNTVTFGINIDLPNNVTADNAILIFSKGGQTISRTIAYSGGTVQFTGEEAKSLLGSNLIVNVTVNNPIVDGQFPCELCFEGEAAKSLVVAVENHLYWTLQVDQVLPNPDLAMFIITTTLPEGVTLESASVWISNVAEFIGGDYINYGTTDTIVCTPEETLQFVGQLCKARIAIDGPKKNGQWVTLAYHQDTLFIAGMVNHLRWDFY